MSYKTPLLAGIICSGLAVALGAFGAHGLKAILSEYSLGVFELAVRYLMYHGLALAALGVYGQAHSPDRWQKLSLVGFLVGQFFFTGSLILLALTNIRWLGAITPLGGLGYLAGWLFFALAVSKSATQNKT